ncbi:NAD(+) kinase [archaeon SCG-AAA382B04]|nr:NAD(+) kinase [archaeon SCG-AAA382B04]
MNKRIGIVSKYDSEESIKVARNLFTFLSQEDVELSIEQKIADKIGKKGSKINELSHCDFIVTVGGDGTILRTLQRLDKQTPIIGINTGEVGFLTKLEKQNYKEKLEELIRDFEVEERTRVGVEFKKTSEENQRLSPAVNEVVIATSELAKLLKLRATLDGNEIERFRADGLVVATPTGSTAYSMSAGGPIVDPKVEAFLLVPLAPYKLSARPFVVPNKSELEVELLRKGKKADVVIDGQKIKTIQEGDKISFKESPDPALFVKTEGADFYSKVREKLV